MLVYIGVDKETWENVALSYSQLKVKELLFEQDVYFQSKEDFYKNFEDRYHIEEQEMEV